MSAPPAASPKAREPFRPNMNEASKIKLTWSACSTLARDLPRCPVPTSPLDLWLPPAPSAPSPLSLPRPDPALPARTSRVRVPAPSNPPVR